MFSKLAQSIKSFGGVLAVLLAVAGAAQAASPAPGGTSSGVPEIDPGSIASAMTLLVGGVLVMRDSIRRK